MVRIPSVCLGPQVGMLSHLVLRARTYPTTILDFKSQLKTHLFNSTAI